MFLKKNIFLTGGTGLIGSYLLKILLEHHYSVYVLCRSKNSELPESRITRVLKFWGVNVDYRKNIKVLNGDLTKDNLGLDKKILKKLNSDIDEIFHCAALTRFNSNLKDLRSTNVDGTHRICNLAKRWFNEGRLKKINYLSTVYVCGNYKGIFTENDLAVGQSFFTPYEQSKFETEMLIQQFRKKIWIDVFRPPTVAGESHTGKILTFNQALYQALHVLNLELFDYFPSEKNYPFSLVFINDLCNAIMAIMINTKNTSKTYHTFGDQCLSLGEMIKISCRFLNTHQPELISSKLFNKKATSAQKKLLKYNLMFLNTKANLSSSLSIGILKKFNFRYKAVNRKSLLKSLKYAVSAGFAKKRSSKINKR